VCEGLKLRPPEIKKGARGVRLAGNSAHNSLDGGNLTFNLKGKASQTLHFDVYCRSQKVRSLPVSAHSEVRITGCARKFSRTKKQRIFQSNAKGKVYQIE
jgi:hypothetical protein